MSSNPNIPNGRNPLKLRGDQRVATDEQLRQHCPELFDPSFWLGRIRERLESFSFFKAANSLRSRLEPESQKRLDAFISHLFAAVQDRLAQTSFEFSAEEGPSESQTGDPVRRVHPIAVSVKNVDALLDSVLEPLRELETLHTLSSLIVQLQSAMGRTKGSLANFQEHNRRHEIEINVLKSELGELEEQEKKDSLSRSEQAQKEQLEKGIAEHQRDMAKNSDKLDRRKRQASSQQRTIDQIAHTLSQFLSRFDPQNSEPLPESLSPAGLAQDSPAELSAPALAPDIRMVLQEKREGEYVSYNVSAARKRSVKRWIPRLAVLLALAGGAYAVRDRIGVMLGSKIDPIALEQWGIPMPTDPTLVEQLTLHNPRLAALKLRIIRCLGSQFNHPEHRDEILQATTLYALADLIASQLQIMVITTEDFGSPKGNLNPNVVEALRAEFGRDIEIGIALPKDKDPKISFAEIHDNPFPLFDTSYSLKKKEMCDASIGKILRVELKSGEEKAVAVEALAMKKTEIDPYCEAYADKGPMDNSEANLATLREKILNYPPFAHHISRVDRLNLMSLKNEANIMNFALYLIGKKSGSMQEGTTKFTVDFKPDDYKALKEMFGDDVIFKFLPSYPGGSPEMRPYVTRVLKHPFFSSILKGPKQFDLISVSSVYELKKLIPRYFPTMKMDIVKLEPYDTDYTTYQFTIFPDAAEALRAVFGDKISFSITTMTDGGTTLLSNTFGKRLDFEKAQMYMAKDAYCKPNNGPVLVMLTPTGKQNEQGEDEHSAEYFLAKPEYKLKELCPITPKGK